MKSVPDPTAADISPKVLMCCEAEQEKKLWHGTGWKFVPRDELWITGIGPKHMVQHTISKTHIDMWDRHFLGLKPGCAWTSIICSQPSALAFRPWTAPEDSVLVIPENLIERIYDMANGRLIHTANM